MAVPSTALCQSYVSICSLPSRSLKAGPLWESWCQVYILRVLPWLLQGEDLLLPLLWHSLGFFDEGPFLSICMSVSTARLFQGENFFSTCFAFLKLSILPRTKKVLIKCFWTSQWWEACMSKQSVGGKPVWLEWSRWIAEFQHISNPEIPTRVPLSLSQSKTSSACVHQHLLSWFDRSIDFSALLW